MSHWSRDEAEEESSRNRIGHDGIWEGEKGQARACECFGMEVTFVMGCFWRRRRRVGLPPSFVPVVGPERLVSRDREIAAGRAGRQKKWRRQ